jgi:hypothetical protein
MPNLLEFQRSITNELLAVKDRVTNLIDHAHNGETGNYREAILKTILRKYLPKNISVGTGFILGGEGELKSKQLDIIIYDNTIPVLFSDGDFIITTMQNVRGIIEVKSRIDSYVNLKDAILQFDNSLLPFHERLLNTDLPKIFTGILSYEVGAGFNIESNHIDDHLRNSRRIVNHISLNKDLFIRKWRNQDAIELGPPAIDCNTDFYNVYKINNLSFSYFISNLIHIVSGGLNDRYWFSFPIDGTKEVVRLRAVCLPNI